MVRSVKAAAAHPFRQGDRYSRCLVRFRCQPCRRAGRPRQPAPGRRIFTWKAAISIGAGFTVPCSPRWAPAGRPLRAVLTHGFVVDADGQEDVQVHGQRGGAQRGDQPIRGRDPALWVSASDYRDDPHFRQHSQAAQRCLPPHSQYQPIHAGQPERFRSGQDTVWIRNR
jgi:hypothetical protein